MLECTSYKYFTNNLHFEDKRPNIPVGRRRHESTWREDRGRKGMVLLLTKALRWRDSGFAVCVSLFGTSRFLFATFRSGHPTIQEATQHSQINLAGNFFRGTTFAGTTVLGRQGTTGEGMQTHNQPSRRGRSVLGAGLLTAVIVCLFVLSSTQPAQAIPAFARKYGLPCSACHEAWPKLNDFGQVFKDNGYQLGNDKDAPIFHEPAYWPVSFRITPNWHRENTDKVLVDQAASGVQGITTHGFDLSGLDILTAGTLNKNISFLL